MMRLSEKNVNIAAVVTDRTPAAELRRARRLGVSIVEVRADLFESADTAYVVDVLRRFKGFKKLVTIRLPSEGGRWRFDESRRLALFEAILPYVDAVDVELNSRSARRVVRLAHLKKKTVIASYHHFKKTPSLAVLKRLARKGFGLGADIVKIAAHIRKPENMRVLADWTLSYPPGKTIAIGMGPQGRITRVLYPLLGSALTYAHLGLSSAPGQMSLDELLCYTDRHAG